MRHWEQQTVKWPSAPFLSRSKPVACPSFTLQLHQPALCPHPTEHMLKGCKSGKDIFSIIMTIFADYVIVICISNRIRMLFHLKPSPIAKKNLDFQVSHTLTCISITSHAPFSLLPTFSLIPAPFTPLHGFLLPSSCPVLFLWSGLSGPSCQGQDCTLFW